MLRCRGGDRERTGGKGARRLAYPSPPLLAWVYSRMPPRWSCSSNLNCVPLVSSAGLCPQKRRQWIPRCCQLLTSTMNNPKQVTEHLSLHTITNTQLTIILFDSFCVFSLWKRDEHPRPVFQSGMASCWLITFRGWGCETLRNATHAGLMWHKASFDVGRFSIHSSTGLSVA